MGHASRYAHQHRKMNFLRIVKGKLHHVVSFLLTARFKRWNHSELGIEAAVLLIL